ncbi:MAG: hypothetical protein Q9163_003511 [Psora crenata]
MAIGIAIIGAGNFAKGAIKACPDFTLKAVYSRTEKCADALATEAGVDAYFQDPKINAKALSVLLARKDIEAVSIALPISVQPTVIRQALEAGKHVLSEKPIADNVKTAEELLQWHSEHGGQTLWSVGENFRFLEPIIFGWSQLRAFGGKVESFSVTLHGFIAENDPFQTPWRRNPDFQGDFILDGGIHFVAALRFLLSAGFTSITHVAAFTSLISPHLRSVDTVNATMRLDNGNSGTFSMSYGTRMSHVYKIRIVTNHGAVTIDPWRVVSTMSARDGRESVYDFLQLDNGVQREIGVFAKGILAREIEARGTPQEALMDLKVMRGILESGEEGGMVKRVI